MPDAIGANLHAMFLIGPVLILGVAASLWASSWLLAGERTAEERLRVKRLAVVGFLMLVASLANPQGWEAHLAYFTSGDETLALSAVSDEWNRLEVWRLPPAFGPPTWPVWTMTWICLMAVAVASVRLLLEWGTGRDGRQLGFDPALLALAFAGSAASLIATRFVWLGIFALGLAGAMLVGHARSEGSNSNKGETNAGSPPLGPGRLGAIAFVTLVLTGLHFTVGDFPNVSRTLRSGRADYRAPYDAARFHAHAVFVDPIL